MSPARLGVRLLVAAGLLAVLVSACLPTIDSPPAMSASSAVDMVGPTETPHLASDRVQREARLTIPPGALEANIGGSFTLAVITMSSDPFAAVEFEVGDPIGQQMVVDRTGHWTENWEWEPPSDCADGCDVVVPVTIQQTGRGETPKLGWTATFYARFDTWDPPAAADDLTVVIEPVDS